MNRILDYRFQWSFDPQDNDLLTTRLTNRQVNELKNNLPPDFSITYLDNVHTLEYRATGDNQQMYKFLCAKTFRGTDLFRQNISKYNHPVFVELGKKTTIMWLFRPESLIKLDMPYEAYEFTFPSESHIYRVR